MLLKIRRSDGKTGVYSQTIGHRSEILTKRLAPETLFCCGPIVIGVHNPLSVLNADEVCWISVETSEPTQKLLPEKIDSIVLLSGREAYEIQLARQWSLWMKHKKSDQTGLMEAFVELSFRDGDSLYLHVTGKTSDSSLVDAFFGLPAITATFQPQGTVFINPKCIVRARVYHSREKIDFPNGIWVAEADDL